MHRILTFTLVASAVACPTANYAATAEPSRNDPPVALAASLGVSGKKPGIILELRGILICGGSKKYFRICDGQGGAAAWVQLGETGHPFVVKDYDSATDSVSVEYNGAVIQLMLTQSRRIENALGEAAGPASRSLMAPVPHPPKPIRSEIPDNFATGQYDPYSTAKPGG